MTMYKVEAPDGVMHLIEGPEGATPEQVIAQAQQLIPAKAKSSPTGQPGSPERQQVIDQALQKSMAPEQLAKEKAEILSKDPYPTAATMGAVAGGALGEGLGSVPLAALGAAGGQAIDQLVGRDQPKTGGEAAQHIATEGALGGAAQALGLGAGKAVSALVSGIGQPIAREVLTAAEKVGIPISAEKLSESPIGKMARRIPGAGMFVRASEKKAGEGIEKAAAEVTGGVGKLEDIDFGKQVDSIIHAPDTGVLARAKAAKDAAYAEVDKLADPVKHSRVPTFLLQEAREIGKEVAKQPPSLRNETLQGALRDINNLYQKAPMPGVAGGYRKLDYSTLRQWQQSYAEKAYHTKDPLYAPVERQMARLANAAKDDIAAIKDPALQQAISKADAVYKERMAPFKKGEGKLSALISGDEQGISNALTGSQSAQVIRELRPHLQPEELKVIQNQIVRKVVSDSRDLTTRQIVGSKLLPAIEQRQSVLREAFDPDYANDLSQLARVMKVAQKGIGSSWIKDHSVAAGIGAGIGFGVGVHEGSYIWQHPGISAAIVLPGAAIGALMGTRRGVRLLMTGFSGGKIPLEIGQGIGKAVTGAATGKLMSLQPGFQQHEDTKEQFAKTMEQAFGPVVQKQVQASKPGPAGEPPLAKIGGSDHPLDAIIAASATDAKLSPQFAKAVFTTESAMNTQATSPKGAQGIAQLMPATARSLGVKNPYDPTEAIPAATGHLANLMQKYGGDKRLALAAYSAGEPAVDRFKGVPPYRETQDYVQKVLKKEQELTREREKIVEASKKSPESWPAILKNYQEAKARGSKEAWSDLRTAVSKHVNKQGGDPTLGMSPQEYQRWKPVILAAMKPETEKVSAQGVDARSAKANMPTQQPEFSDNQMTARPGMPEQAPPPQPVSQPTAQPTPAPQMARAQPTPVSSGIRGMDRRTAFRLVSGILSQAERMQLPPQIAAAAHHIRSEPGDAFTKAVRLADLLVAAGVVTAPAPAEAAFGG